MKGGSRGRSISHEVRPLHGRRAIAHFAAKVGREDFEEPVVRVLVCHGPGGGASGCQYFCECVRGGATGQSKSNTTSCFLAIMDEWWWWWLDLTAQFKWCEYVI